MQANSAAASDSHEIEAGRGGEIQKEEGPLEKKGEKRQHLSVSANLTASLPSLPPFETINTKPFLIPSYAPAAPSTHRFLAVFSATITPAGSGLTSAPTSILSTTPQQ